MGHANIVVGDMHCGSTYGLWPPDALLDEGGKHTLNPYQAYIWECWQHAWETWLPSVIGDMPRILWLMGDLVEGIHHNGGGILAVEEATQVRAAVTALQPHAKNAERVFAVSGTEAHAGKSAQWDNLVAQAVGAERDEATGRWARWECWQQVDGVTIHAAHHIGGSFVPQSDMTPLVRETIDMAVGNVSRHWPMPDVMLRGHAHITRWYERGGRLVLVSPSWQARTPFAYRIRRGKPPSIGMAVVITDEGNYEHHVKEYAWPKPHVGVIGWTSENQNQDSVTKSGPTSSALSRLKQRLVRNGVRSPS